MNGINVGGWLVALVAGIIVTVGFDVVLHGLSHSGHGFLNSLWDGETSQRRTKTDFFNGILWHVLADSLLALIISILIVLTEPVGFLAWVIIGTLFGCLLTVAWMHAYAALEIKGKLAATLGGLAVLQSMIASVVIGWIYHGWIA